MIGQPLIRVAETPSTNDLVWDHAKSGAPEGLTVVADHQTAGRGRFGRVWHSPPGLALAVSVLLRPSLEPTKLSLLTAAAAVAACDTTRAFGVAASIRWPNDVVARGRKLSGVLVEGRDGSAFVLGCGLNVNITESDFPDDVRAIATSLRMETGREHDRESVLATLLKRFDARYAEALAGDPVLARDWKEMSALLGKRVRITEASRDYSGEVADLDVLEGIVLRLGGNLRRFRLEHVERLTEVDSSRAV